MALHLAMIVPGSWKRVCRVLLGASSLALLTLLASCANTSSSDPKGGRSTLARSDRSGPEYNFSGGISQRSPFSIPVRRARERLNQGTDPAAANEIAILEDGEDALLARIHLIRSATRSIDIQTFIWTHDEAGTLLMQELMTASKRGVRVRILVDHFGAAKNAALVAWLSLLKGGPSIKIYRPAANELETGTFKTLLLGMLDMKGSNQRMHNKVFVVDGQIGITGGRNVEDTYYNLSPRTNFKDRDALVVGPAAAMMRMSFEEFWQSKYSVPAARLRDVQREIRAMQQEKRKEPFNWNAGQDLRLAKRLRSASKSRTVQSRIANQLQPAARAEFIYDHPGKNRKFWIRGGGEHTRRLAKTVSLADKSIVIQSPYLVLSNSTIRTFRNIRKKHPKMPIVVSTNSYGSTDNHLAYAGNVRQRLLMVDGLGMTIHEYRPHPVDLHRILPRFQELDRQSRNDTPTLCLHSKSLVIDDRSAYVGSFNFDPRSTNLNTEAGLLIEDPAIARRIKANILRDTLPGNAWIIAKRPAYPGTLTMSRLTRPVTSLLPVDVTLIRFTSAFELKRNRNPVPSGHPEFFRNFRDVGEFPGSDGTLTQKEIMTRFIKRATKSLTPLL